MQSVTGNNNKKTFFSCYYENNVATILPEIKTRKVDLFRLLREE